MNPDLKTFLPDDLQARLNVIIQRVPLYWELKRYNHFTNHGITHSERVYRSKLAYLAQELPEKKRLTADEIFIVSAASWLYEIGMQSPYLEPTLAFNIETDGPLTFSDLQQIRANKHVLTERLIMGDYDGQALSLGLMGQRDEYEKVIAKVCRFISDDPIDQVPETLAVKGMPVRVRLLVALLRLADQLYIDSTRIAPDLLQKFNLPLENLAYWWMFNYVQTLPINNGQIPFSYFLPLSQREYLNHIRGFVESKFEYDKNPVIQCLWKYELKLMPSKSPTVQFDQYQSSRFQNLLSENLIYFLRQNVKPVTNGEYNFQAPDIDLHNAKNALIIDYENFITQLGQEGFFYSQEEIYRLLITLLGEAKKNFGGSIDGYAIGHWNRPDLSEAGNELKKRTYELIDLNAGQDDANIVDGFLKKLASSGEVPANLIFVTPNPNYAVLTKQYQSSRSTITAWLSGLPEAAVFQVTAHQYKLVSDILGLKRGEIEPLEKKSLIEYSCILRIDDELHTKYPHGLSDEEIMGCLIQVLGNAKNHLWWKLWLINNNILTTNDQKTFFINTENATTKRVLNLRSYTIRAFIESSIQPLSLNNNLLFAKLRSQFNAESEITEFLTLLKDEDIVRRELKPSDDGDLITWHINSYHWALVAEYPQRYLTIFVLALDQVLLRNKYPYLHEHSLKNKLTLYLGNQNVFNFIYQLAKKENIVSLQSGQGRQDEDNVTCVNLNLENNFVCETLRNRDILLNGLRRKSLALPPIQFNALYQKLSSIRSFSVKKFDFDAIIGVLNKDQILLVFDDGVNQNLIQLNIDDDLVKRFLGRLYIHGLIRSLRLMGCTRVENKKSKQEVIENISRYVTSNDNLLATWALEFSQSIKLVICENQSSETETVYLNNHSFIRHLDRRESTVIKTLLNLIQSIKGDAEGWIPRYIMTRSMERDYVFGYSLGEYEYWLDQSIHARQWRVLEEKKVRMDGAMQSFIRPAKR